MFFPTAHKEAYFHPPQNQQHLTSTPQQPERFWTYPQPTYPQSTPSQSSYSQPTYPNSDQQNYPQQQSPIPQSYSSPRRSKESHLFGYREKANPSSIPHQSTYPSQLLSAPVPRVDEVFHDRTSLLNRPKLAPYVKPASRELFAPSQTNPSFYNPEQLSLFPPRTSSPESFVGAPKTPSNINRSLTSFLREERPSVLSDVAAKTDHVGVNILLDTFEKINNFTIIPPNPELIRIANLRCSETGYKDVEGCRVYFYEGDTIFNIFYRGVINIDKLKNLEDKMGWIAKKMDMVIDQKNDYSHDYMMCRKITNLQSQRYPLNKTISPDQNQQRVDPRKRKFSKLTSLPQTSLRLISPIKPNPKNQPNPTKRRRQNIITQTLGVHTHPNQTSTSAKQISTASTLSQSDVKTPNLTKTVPEAITDLAKSSISDTKKPETRTSQTALSHSMTFVNEKKKKHDSADLSMKEKTSPEMSLKDANPRSKARNPKKKLRHHNPSTKAPSLPIMPQPVILHPDYVAVAQVSATPPNISYSSNSFAEKILSDEIKPAERRLPPIDKKSGL